METEAGIEALTQRQKEILRLISQQYQTKEIARSLNIGERTVKTHTEEARRRLGVASSRDAARLLAAHEAVIGRDDRGTPRPMAGEGTSSLSQPHEQAYLSQSLLSGDTLERPGNSVEGPVNTGEAAVNSANSGRHPAALLDQWSDGSLVRPDRGDRLVDRRREGFEKKLARLNAFQWLGLIVVVGVLSAILVSGLIAAVLGTLEGLQLLNRQIG